MAREYTGGKLDLNMTRFVVKCLTLNKKQRQIREEFGFQFHRTISPSGISYIKRRHLTAIMAGQSQIVEKDAVSAITLNQQALRLLQNKMDRAEQDMVEIDGIRERYKNGAWSDSEYKAKLGLYVEMSTSELTAIANMTHNLSKNIETPPPSPQDAAALAVLIKGIQSGSPMQLVQMLNPTFNKTSNNDEPEKEPVTASQKSKSPPA